MAITLKLTINSVDYDITNYVVKDSLKISYSLFKDLEPTTNKLELRIIGTAPAIPALMNSTDKVLIQVYDGAAYYFTGYLTDNYTWQITNRGKQPVIISAEDHGIKLLKKSWVSSNQLYTLYTNLKICDPADTANSIVHNIATLAGATVDSAIPAILDTLSLNIQDKDNKTYWEVLDDICYEYGYVFYFNEFGKLNLYKIAKTTITPVATFSTATNILAESDNKGFDLKKQLQQYKQINLTWDEWETKNNIYVFRESTNGDNTYDCNIELAAGAYYPEGADADTFVFSEYKSETGQDIINVNSATIEYVVDSGITVEFENLGTRGKLRIKNSSAVAANIRKLKVKGNTVIVKKNTNVNKAGENTAPILKYTAKYIHDLTTANNFVNTLKNHYAFSNYNYTFKSKTNVELGSVVNFQDATWNTVNKTVLIIGKELKENNVITYTAIGIDQFDMSGAVPRDITLYTDNNLQSIAVPRIITPSITIGDTEVKLGESVSTVNGVTVNGTVAGNAETASKLLIARTIGLSGKIAGTATAFDGSTNITIDTTSAAITSAEVTDATSANTINKIVKRDGSGNFSAGTITASLSGNASTATKLASARTIGISGKVTGTATNFDGSGNITISTTAAAITSAEITDATAANTASMVVKRDANGDFSASAVTLTKQKLLEYTIPGSTNKILQLKNTATGQTDGDVFSIFEIRSPDTANTESTLSQHNVVSGSDDWVRDISFHNYGSKMKAVDVLQHFTGTTAGDWQWVSRYTNGTNYSMVDRYLMTIEGDTGNLKLGEDDTLATAARAKLDVRNKGWTTTPSLLVSIDSSHSSQPSALIAQNGNNYAYSGNLTTLKLLNGSDTGTVLKLENAGTGNYIVADNVFTLSKSGSIAQVGANGMSNNFISGSVGTGWKLDYNSSVTGKSYLEVDNLLVRDTIRTHIFQKDVIKATNGQLYVSDSGVIAKNYDGTEPYVVHLDIDKSATFSVNDEIVVKDINLSSGTVTATTRFKIDSIGTVANGMQPYTVSVIEGTLWNLQTGMSAVRTSGGSVLIDASTTYRPFIDVLNSGVTKARLGNLAGISGCSGYGLYSDNVFLTGKITATSGSFTGKISAGSGSTIGGWTSATDKLSSGNARLYSSGILSLGSADGYNTTNSIYLDGANSRFSLGTKLTYTGDTLTINGNITSSSATITGGTLSVGSNFSVTNTGVLTASGASISGAITATSGSFNGSITSNSATITGGSLSVGSKFSVTTDGTLSATNATIAGTLNAVTLSASGKLTNATKNISVLPDNPGDDHYEGLFIANSESANTKTPSIGSIGTKIGYYNANSCFVISSARSTTANSWVSDRYTTAYFRENADYSALSLASSYSSGVVAQLRVIASNTGSFSQVQMIGRSSGSKDLYATWKVYSAGTAGVFYPETETGVADADIGSSSYRWRNLYLSGQMDCYAIDDDSAPLATKASETLNPKSGGSLFSVYKPITCTFVNSGNTSMAVQLYRNGAYYNLVGTALMLNPGRYRFYNGDPETTGSATLYCVGVYGSASATGIWS